MRVSGVSPFQDFRPGVSGSPTQEYHKEAGSFTHIEATSKMVTANLPWDKGLMVIQDKGTQYTRIKAHSLGCEQ